MAGELGWRSGERVMVERKVKDQRILDEGMRCSSVRRREIMRKWLGLLVSKELLRR